jgi:tetratricopeptide (TPR) repeat protein
MKLKLYTLLFIGISSLAVSCKTASKLYEKGRYDEAVELAAKKLQKDPNDPKLLEILQNAYRYAVDDHESRIRNYDAGTNELKWEWIYNEYADLQRLYESIRRSPDVFNRIKPLDYSSYMVTYREKAGDTRYQRGLSLLSSGNKQDARKAYSEFQTALQFIPGDLNIQQKREEAFSYAVVNVIVLPVEERGSYQFSSYSNRYRNFDDQVLRYLKNNNNNQFVRYYSSWEARGTNIRPDYFVDVRFSSFNIGRQYDEVSTRTVSKEVVVKETVYKPDSVVKEYAKVYAKINTTNRSIRSQGTIQAIVRDANNHRAWSDNYTGQHFWTTSFATYTGDSRALSESDKQLIDTRPQPAPREDDIIRSIVDEIQSKAECGVKDYFNKY